MSLLKRALARRRMKGEDRAAIAQATQEAMRSGDEPQKTMADIVGEAFDKFPPGT
jgi:hypothetical protein